METAFGVKFDAPGVGGDLDVIASAEGRLVAIELKSSPPKHVAEDEVRAFVLRTRTLRPHVAIFAVDTALRLGDKVVPLLAVAADTGAAPVRIDREIWAISRHVYAVNGKPSLLGNIARAIGEGLRALAPEPF
jgi:hypothetical protein